MYNTLNVHTDGLELTFCSCVVYTRSLRHPEKVGITARHSSPRDQIFSVVSTLGVWRWFGRLAVATLPCGGCASSRAPIIAIIAWI